MNWHFLGRALLVTSSCLTMAGCESISRVTKPIDPYYTAEHSAYNYVINSGDGASKTPLKVTVACISDNGAASQGGANAVVNPCSYKSVSETKNYKGENEGNSPSLDDSPISKFFATCNLDNDGTKDKLAECQLTRNTLLDVLVRVTDENCSTFLQKVFFYKSASDSVYNTSRDALTGGTALAAIPSPPTAVGFSIGSLFLRSYESINQSFFLNETFQPIEVAINSQRVKVLEEVDKCKGKKYHECSVNRGMSLVKQYSDACSLREGIKVLQALVHVKDLTEKNTKALEDTSKAASKLADTAQAMMDSKNLTEKNIKNLDEKQKKLISAQDELQSTITTIKEEVKSLNSKVKDPQPATTVTPATEAVPTPAETLR